MKNEKLRNCNFLREITDRESNKVAFSKLQLEESISLVKSEFSKEELDLKEMPLYSDFAERKIRAAYPAIFEAVKARKKLLRDAEIKWRIKREKRRIE